MHRGECRAHSVWGLWGRQVLLRSRWGHRPAPAGPAAGLCCLALRDLLTYDNTPADVDCLVCQGRGLERSCFLPPRAGRNWK